jgi:two-component system LytT family response regulator
VTVELRVLIVDDEPLARRGLALRLAAYPWVEVIGECGDGASALAFCARDVPDAMFLDVQMPGLDGFATLAAIPLSAMPLVAFVTAYDRFALRAFEASAIDYLLKPVEEARLSETVKRMRDALRTGRRAQEADRLFAMLGGALGAHDAANMQTPAHGTDGASKPLMSPKLGLGDRLLLKDGHRNLRLALSTVRWIDAAGDYACFHTDNGVVIARLAIAALEAQLAMDAFVRIHRSTVVNIARVAEIRPFRNGEQWIRLDCGQELKLSRSYRDRLAHLRV